MNVRSILGYVAYALFLIGVAASPFIWFLACIFKYGDPTYKWYPPLIKEFLRRSYEYRGKS